MDMIKDKPWLGYGRGDFESAYVHYTAVRNYIDPSYPGAVLTNLVHPHNEFLFWWVEGGILPVMAAGIFAWIVIRALYHTEKRHKVFFLLLLPIGLHAMFEQPLMHSVPHLLMLTLAIYLTTNLDRPAPLKVFTFEEIRIAGILAGTLVFILPSLYMINAFHNIILVKAFSERPAKHADMLKNVIYPGNQNTALNIIVYTELMNYAIANNDENRARIFFNWAEREMRYRPRLGILKNLAYSYYHFGYEEKMTATQALISYYFADSLEFDAGSQPASETSAD
jgi:O-antigen polymerase